MFGQDERVKVDIAHAELVGALVKSLKPENILEFGIGGGRTTDEIISAINYNKNNPRYTLVDNWLDFGFKIPKEVLDKYSGKINIISANERDFVFSTQDKFDFIFSDADHNSTDQWFEYVYDNLLNDQGVLIYHDINIFPELNQEFPNLVSILEKAKTRNLKYRLFNKSSLAEERCYRGLLVIFK